ncbi:hypothetical protein SAMN05443428_11082 [Caloramator quimbayensis]|uniref:V/A-type H+-transporting ATPase subunit I n=1 Tax=Caloramator quimbayensis TaxID=1147123 RepID=A0A1T4XN33_9CLOT|nr:hypothetical protein [Caloramator quimbayensis]SKA90495.1 hypothetical protein SAMN05443428_11082 [Caloramator quimbayensis]
MLLKKKQAVNIVGYMDDIDGVLRNLIKNEYFDLADANKELKERIKLHLDNVNASAINSQSSGYDLDDIKRKLDAIIKLFDLKNKEYKMSEDEEYEFKIEAEKINKIYDEVIEKHNALQKINNEYEDLKKLNDYLLNLKDTDKKLKELINMRYIKLKAGKLIKYNMDKIKKNYENIPAIVFKIYENKNEAFILVLVPDAMEIEVNRALNSLNFEEYKIDISCCNDESDYFNELNNKMESLKTKIESLDKELLNIKKNYTNDIMKYKTHLDLELYISRYKSNVAWISQFFFIAGYFPKKKREIIEKLLKPYSSRLIIDYCDLN